MSGQSMDPEELAALLDGTLSDAERDAALERLARSPEDFEAFVEAAALLRDADLGACAPVTLSARTSPALVVEPAVPREKPKRARWSVRVWMPIAAVLTFAVLIPTLTRRGDAGDALLDGKSLVATVGDGSLTTALGAGWEQPGWSVTRGTGATSTAERNREFRTGTRFVDLEIALDAGDHQAAAVVATDLIAVLSRIESSGAAVAQYQPATQPDGARAFAANRSGARDELLQLLGESPWFDLGVWTEQARLASLAGKRAFFDERAERALADVAERLAAGNVSTLEQLQRLRELIRAGSASVDLAAVRAVLAPIIRENGG